MPQDKGSPGDNKESVRHAQWVREHPRLDESAFPEYPDEKKRRGSSRGATPNGNPWRPLEPDEKPGRVESQTAGGPTPAVAVDAVKEHAGRLEETPNVVAGEPTHKPAVVRASHVADERIGQAIGDVLANSKSLEGTHILVEVIDGEVTLRGSVRDAQVKSEVEQLASSVRGTKRIQNDVTVGP